MKKSLLTLYLLGLLGICKVSAQQHIQVDDSYTAQQLVNALIDNSCAQVSNINIQGSDGNKSFAHFTNGSNIFPFTNGIILSTGFASSATGPNSSLLSEGSSAWLGDNDLEIALGVSNTINATVLEFDFIPFTDKISFDYIFSSEQYLTSITSQNQCNYTDGFAFLIKEASGNTPYTNIAVVPGTDIPVKVNTVRGQGVCPSANEQYFDSFNDFEHPTNFNGQTVILQAKTDVIPGTTYHIKLVVADQGNNLYDSAIFLGGGSFKNITNLGVDRLFETNNPLCSGETLQLNAFRPNATGYKWYKDDVLQPITSSIFTVTSGGNYSVVVEFGLGCTSTGKIKVEESNPPLASAYTLIQCDDDKDGITTYNLDLAYNMVTNNDTSLYVHYYLNMNDALTSSNPVINTSSFHNSTPNQIIYAQVMTPYSCFSISPITLATSNNALINPSPIDSCDEYGTNDGITTFDLTQRESQILQNLPSGLSLQYFTSSNDALLTINPIANPLNFLNTTPYNQTIYTRVYSSGDCYGIVPIQLLVYSFGNDLNDEEIILCENKTLTLDAGNGYNSYEWNTNPHQYSQRIIITEPGSYSVTLTNDQGCTGTKTFNITPSEKATSANIKIDDFKGDNNNITIEPVGNGNYEFSIDGKSYQDSNLFNHLTSGKYKVYIKDKNGCGTLIQEFYILDYPKFFTPNNDNSNDVWTIHYLNFIPDAEVYIFDRYGKVITSFKGSGSWDGTLNGKDLPATDYWFVINLKDRSIKGHFSLIR